MAEPEKKQAAEDNKIDHYVKMGLIATGKHAQVWEVQEENTSNRFAMKLLLPEAMKDPEQVSALKFEGKVAQSLDHPNIIKWIATVHRKTNIYLILELFKAYNIKTYLLNDLVGLQSRLRKLIECSCLALQHMHEKGWVHLDVKPDNILMNRSSEVRLIDFSLSQRIKGALGKMFGGKKEIGGTLTYIAPETIRKESATPQTDIYSLGVTLYECLTGTSPFKGSTPKDLLMKHLTAIPAPPSDLNKNVTPEMDRMVLRMLAKKAKDRQKNMQEVMSELRNVQPFKEDPEKLREQKLAEEKAAAGEISLAKRLDSRTDAARSERAKVDPEFAKQQEEKAKAAASASSPAVKLPDKPKTPKSPKPAAAPVPSPMMPAAMPPGMIPQMQFTPAPMPYMMPGQFPQMPGYPGMPPQMPGYPGAGGMPGMLPTPAAGMMPPYGMPGYPAPQMPLPGMSPGVTPIPPQQPPPQIPPPATAPPTSPVPVRSVLQRPEPPPVPKDVNPDELPTMEELPEVL